MQLPITRDIQLLYELSLAVGRTLDLNRCCSDFLTVLLARKNISYAAVWIQDHHLLREGNKDEVRLVYALPRSRAREATLPLSHPAMCGDSDGPYRSVSSEDPEYRSRICEHDTECGTLAIFRLGELGWLRLFSRDATSLSDRELVKLRNVVEKFTTAIEASLLHQRILYEIEERRRSEEERARLERQVLHAQKLESLGILAGGIAHDFNNLLVGILGHAELARADVAGSAPVLESLDAIVKASEKAADLCRQMLAYSGKASHVVRPTDLGGMLREIPALMKAAISKSIRIRDQVQPDLPPVLADVTQMHQLMLNLITNASEAIGDAPGVITLSTGIGNYTAEEMQRSASGRRLPPGLYEYFEVSDDGCGMNEETRLKIFDPFYSTKFTGRGLGLATVLGIVRGHGGAINVKSAPGEGTSVQVLLPVTETAPSEPAAPVAPDVETSKATILVVDDEEIVLGVAEAMLRRAGFEVQRALGGARALDMFRQDPARFDLLLVDLTMPDVGGFEVFRQVRAVREDLPVLLYSGYDEQETTGRLAGQRLTGFIHKPFSARQLVDKVREALQTLRPTADDGVDR
jgi:signal transduction histidine kinase/ActR/RegA family two-component response regulator